MEQYRRDFLLEDCHSKRESVRVSNSAFQNLVFIFARGGRTDISSPRSTRRGGNPKENCAIAKKLSCTFEANARENTEEALVGDAIYSLPTPLARTERGLFRFAATSDGGIIVTFEPGGMCRRTPRGGIERQPLEAGQEGDRGRVARGRSQSANDDEIDSPLARCSMSIQCSAREQPMSAEQKVGEMLRVWVTNAPSFVSMYRMTIAAEHDAKHDETICDGRQVLLYDD